MMVATPSRAPAAPPLVPAATRFGLPSTHKIGSRTKLRPRDVGTYRSLQPPLLAEVAEVVCSTQVLPRKELFEAWAVASCVHATFPTVRRVADLAAGHGLLAWLLLLLAAEQGAERTAVCVDIRMPVSAETLGAAFTSRWPGLTDSLHYVEGGIDSVRASPDVLLASVHACGPLSDAVLARAAAARSPVAVMPCCHSLRKQPLPPVRGLTEQKLRDAARALGPAVAIDGFRMEALRQQGYTVFEATVPHEITPYNRLLLGSPPARGGATGAAAAAAEQPAVSAAVPAAGSSAVPAAARRKSGAAPVAAPILLGDVAAVAAIAGRRPVVWERSIELSLWLSPAAETGGEEVRGGDAPAAGWQGGGKAGWQADLDGASLAVLCSRASTAAWRPRAAPRSTVREAPAADPDCGLEADDGADGANAAAWDVASAVRAATVGREAAACDGEAWAVGSGWELRDSANGVTTPAATDAGHTAGSAGALSTPTPPRVRVVLREVYQQPGSGRRAACFRVDFSSGREITRAQASMWQSRIRAALRHWAAASGHFELR